MADIPEMQTTIGLVASQSGFLANFLSGLGEGDWERSSACADWSVGDVVAHLTQGAGGWAATLERAVQGDANPPPGQRLLQAGERGSDVTAQRAIEYRQTTSPAQLLQSFGDEYRKLRQLLQGLTDQDWEKPCFHRRGVLPVGDYVARRVQELAVHGWDLRSPFDRDCQIPEEVLPMMVSLTHRWLSNTFGAVAGEATPVRFRFDVSGPVPVREDVVVNQSGFEIETSGGAADVTIRCNTSDYILLVYGRLPLAEATARGNLQLEGETARAASFNRWFQGV